VTACHLEGRGSVLEPSLPLVRWKITKTKRGLAGAAAPAAAAAQLAAPPAVPVPPSLLPSFLPGCFFNPAATPPLGRGTHGVAGEAYLSRLSTSSLGPSARPREP
jgi:hypothetical protein